MSKTFRDSKRAKARRSRKQRWEQEYYKEEYIAFVREYSLKEHEWQYTGAEVKSHVWLKKPGGPKKHRSFLDQDHYWYQHTPSWFVRLFMHKPKRRGCRMWENEAVTSPVDLLDTLECPDYGRKPHKYYY